MSYIQIEIGGEKRGLKFNTAAHNVFIKEFNKYKDFYEAASRYAIVWAGLVGNAIAKHEDFTLEWEQVTEWADKLDEQVVIDVIKVYQSTQEYKKLIPEEKEEDKKKSQSKNTKRNVSK